MKTQVRWRKARRSGPTSNCVEVPEDLAAVRDSKNPTVVLQGDIRRLLHVVAAGYLTR